MTMAVGVQRAPARSSTLSADRVTDGAWPYTTQRWQRLRRAKLRERPLCEACLQTGRIVPAAAVDHGSRSMPAAIHFRLSTGWLHYARAVTTPRHARNSWASRTG